MSKADLREVMERLRSRASDKEGVTMVARRDLRAMLSVCEAACEWEENPNSLETIRALRRAVQEPSGEGGA